jgi:hypothetical protein
MSYARSTPRWLSSQQFARGDRPSGPHPQPANALFAMGNGRWLSLDDAPPPACACCLAAAYSTRQAGARAPAPRTARGPALRTSQDAPPQDAPPQDAPPHVEPPHAGEWRGRCSGAARAGRAPAARDPCDIAIKAAFLAIACIAMPLKPPE